MSFIVFCNQELKIKNHDEVSNLNNQVVIVAEKHDVENLQKYISLIFATNISLND